MILTLDVTIDVPIYQQLRDRIVEAIAAGHAPAGSSLPPSRALASNFGINFHTVNKAYALLREQGLIRLNRNGAVVIATAPDAAFRSQFTARARTVLAEGVARGLSPDEVLATCRQLLESFSNSASKETSA